MSRFPIYFQLHVYNLELWIQVLLQHISTSFVIWCFPLNLDNLLLKTSLLNLKFNGPHPKIIYISDAVLIVFQLNLMFTVFRVEYIFFLWHFHCFTDSKHIEYQQLYHSSLCNSFGADTFGFVAWNQAIRDRSATCSSANLRMKDASYVCAIYTHS